MNPCDNCNAPIAVHESMGCAGDRLHNAKVDMCGEIASIFGRIYAK